MKVGVILGFTVGGAVVGLIAGGGMMRLGLSQVRGAPGMAELLVISAMIIGMFVVPGTLGGFLLGCIVSLVARKK